MRDHLWEERSVLLLKNYKIESAFNLFKRETERFLRPLLPRLMQ
jgi:hypothetical protein